MKDIWKIFAGMAVGYLRVAGEAKKAEDENTTGKDDLIGEGMTYAADLLQALINGKTLPKAPPSLSKSPGK